MKMLLLMLESNETEMYIMNHWSERQDKKTERWRNWEILYIEGIAHAFQTRRHVDNGYWEQGADSLTQQVAEASEFTCGGKDEEQSDIWRKKNHGFC